MASTATKWSWPTASLPRARGRRLALFRPHLPRSVRSETHAHAAIRAFLVLLYRTWTSSTEALGPAPGHVICIRAERQQFASERYGYWRPIADIMERLT